MKIFGDSLKNLAKLLRLWYAVEAKSFKAVPECRPRRAGTASAAGHGYSRESEEFYEKIFRALTLCLVLLSLLCAAVPAAFAAGNKEDTFYTIGLDACGGVSSTVVVTTNLDGKLTTLPESPTMDGYTFNGWYTEPVGGSRITTATVFTGDTTIYAQWTAKSSSASPTAPTLPVTGGPALQKHLGTLLVAGILVTLVVVAAV